jgi:uncharacterized repeat protein (TIGR01451 family)
MAINWLEESSVFLSEPVYRPEFTHQMTASPQWLPVAGSAGASNGEFSVILDTSAGSTFYRLRRQWGSNAVFNLTGLAGGGGSIKPADAFLKTLGERLVFTAAPSDGYAVAAWYLDGQPAQTGGSTFTLPYIDDDHQVQAMFAPTNDLSLGKIALPFAPGLDEESFDAVVGENLDYVITVANTGINPASGVIVTDVLPRSVNFVSAESSQGDITFVNDTVTGALGNLARGASATIKITVIPTVAGQLNNTASVAGSEPELVLSNNQDTAGLMVQAAPGGAGAPATLNRQPSPQGGLRRLSPSNR